MKYSALALMFLGMFHYSSAAAGSKHHYDLAHVVAADPVYQTIEHRVPRESCWTEQVKVREREYRRQSGTPAIIGGIIGGAIGHELGNGSSNKKIGAVVGSILGMSVGSDIQHNRKRPRSSGHHYYEDVERCEVSHTVETERVIKGYDVTYRYHGREYSTFLEEHPGKKMRVAVNVAPVRH